MDIRNQKLTTKQKIKKYGSIEKWAIAIVDSFNLPGNSYISSVAVDKRAMTDNIRLSEGTLVSRDYNDTMFPFPHLADRKPTESIKHYDRVTIRINVLRGEEIKRPFNWFVVSENEDSISDMEKEKTNLLLQYYGYTVAAKVEQQMAAQQAQMQQQQQQQMQMQPMQSQQGMMQGGQPPMQQGMPMDPMQQQMQQQMQPQQQSPNVTEQMPQPMTPEQIEKYMSYTYKDMREKQANNALRFLIRTLNVKHIFQNGWNDFLVTGAEVYRTYVVDNEPKLRRVYPVDFDCESNGDIVYVDECAWAKEIRYMSTSDIYDEFWDVLTEKQIDQIEEWKNSPQQPTDYFIARADSYSGLTTNGVTVMHVEWKSLKRVGFVTRIISKKKKKVTELGRRKILKNTELIEEEDEEIRVETEVVDDDYEAKTYKEGDEWIREEVDYKWINEVWECDKIGQDIYVNIRPRHQQFRRMDSLSECKLSYTGVFTRYSFMDRMRPYQMLFNTVMAKLEDAIVTSIGKVAVMDLAQIPTSFGFDIDKFIHYVKQGFAFINSFEEGKQGVAEGKLPQFNQFQTWEITARDEVQYYLQTLLWIDTQLGEISGVTRERQGQVSNVETVGGVEHSITQSSHVTEYYFELHNEIKRRALQHLLEGAKECWKEGKKAQYVFDDVGRIFFETDDKFQDSDFGVFVTNNAKDYEILQTLKQLAQQAMQAGMATLKDIVEILNANDIVSARKILEDSQKRVEQNAQQQAQAEQQQAQAQMQQAQQQAEMQMQIEQAKLQIEQQKLQLQAQIAQMDNQTKLQIEGMKLEQIQAQDTTAVEQAKVEVEKVKIQSEYAKSQTALQQSQMQLKVNEQKGKTDMQLAEYKLTEAQAKAESEKQQIEIDKEKNDIDRMKVEGELQLGYAELELKKMEIEAEIQMKQMEMQIKQQEFAMKEKEMQVNAQMQQQQMQSDQQMNQQQMQMQSQQQQHEQQMGEQEGAREEKQMNMDNKMQEKELQVKKTQVNSKPSTESKPTTESKTTTK